MRSGSPVAAASANETVLMANRDEFESDILVVAVVDLVSYRKEGKFSLQSCAR
jgi:hypothetical protein